MRKLKKKRVVKKRKRKNPIDEILFDLLAEAILTGNSNHFSNALIYYTTGEKCDDCDQLYYSCACEGSRKKRTKPCEDCKLRKCLCGYNIDRDTNPAKVRSTILKWIEENLNYKNQLNILKNIKNDLEQIDSYIPPNIYYSNSLFEIIFILNEIWN